MKNSAFKSYLPALLIWMAGLCLLFGCASAPQPKSASGKSASTTVTAEQRQSVLKVGVSTNAPPLIYKQGDEIIGLEAELAREFAKSIGKSVEFVELAWTDQIPALLDKRTDIIMSGMTITPKREYRIAFSSPYFRSGQMVMVRGKDKNRYPTGFYGIRGQSLTQTIGVVKGTTGEQFVRKNFGQAKKISSYDTSERAVKALSTIIEVSRIDMLIHDGPILMMLAARNETKDLAILPDLLTEEYLAWGIRKTDPALLNAANQFIEKLKSEGRLNPIIKRWIPYM